MSFIRVLLPAYNEELAIGILLDRIRSSLVSQNYYVLVVDDGSIDKTASIVEEKSHHMPVKLLRRPINSGLGQALSDGFQRAALDYSVEDFLITMDADNTFDPSLISSMIDKMSLGADVVIASRYCEGSKVIGVSVLRRFLSRAISIILTLVFHARDVRDYTSGYRCFRMSFIQRVCKRYDPLLRARGFAAAMEILIKVISENARCVEVPFTLRYDLKPGKTKLHLLRTIVEYIRIIYLCWQDMRRTQAQI